MDKGQRKEQLKAEQAAAYIKLDRCLEELERFGAGRVRDTIEAVAAELDVDVLKSLVFDIEAAKEAIDRVDGELRRLR